MLVPMLTLSAGALSTAKCHAAGVGLDACMVAVMEACSVVVIEEVGLAPMSTLTSPASDDDEDFGLTLLGEGFLPSHVARLLLGMTDDKLRQGVRNAGRWHAGPLRYEAVNGPTHSHHERLLLGGLLA